MKNLHNAGYVALTSMLVIAFIMTGITISISLLSVSEATQALAHKKKAEVRSLVEGCAEDALLSLNENGSLPATRVFPEGSCTIMLNGQTGTSWTFTITATIEQYSQTTQVTADRGNKVSITSWNEIE